jgi:hypothetical protein
MTYNEVFLNLRVQLLRKINFWACFSNYDTGSKGAGE